MAAPMHQARAQDASLTDIPPVQNAAAEEGAVLGDLMDSESPQGKVAATLGNQILTGWAATASKLNKKMFKNLSGRTKKELNRYRIHYTVGLKNPELVNKILGAEATYSIEVGPNFRDGEQVRKDTYVFGIGLNKNFRDSGPANLGVFAGAKVQARITFSRVFTGDNAKINALFDTPYFLTKLPTNADEIKKKMAVGETVRIEILGKTNAGLSKKNVGDLTHVSLGGGYIREALFVVDLYRHSELETRVRMFGLKNSGTFNINARATLSPWTSFVTDNGGALNRVIRDATDFSAYFGISKSASLFKDFPIDTMMLDYLYKFSSAETGIKGPDTAEGAVSELLRNVQKVGFVPLLNLFSPDRDLGQTMKEKAVLSEKLAQEDNGLQSQRVRHLFKGRITSNVRTTTLGVSASKLIGQAEQKLSYMKSYVRSEDTMGQKDYYMLETASDNTRAEAFLERSEERKENDVDILMKANDKQQVTALLDVVTTTEVRDKNFKESELSEAKRVLLASLPPALRSPEVKAFLPVDDQKGSYYRAQYSFGLDAFVALRSYDLDRIAKDLYQFLDTHPRKYMMHLPEDYPRYGGISLPEYVMSLAKLIYQSVGAQFTIEQRVEALHALMQDQVFKNYIIGEFFSRLLPENELQKLAAINLRFSSDETPSKEMTVGEHKVTEVYRFVTFLRTVLNNNSYDLRLETKINESENTILVTPEIRGFNVSISQD